MFKKQYLAIYLQQICPFKNIKVILQRPEKNKKSKKDLTMV